MSWTRIVGWDKWLTSRAGPPMFQHELWWAGTRFASWSHPTNSGSAALAAPAIQQSQNHPKLPCASRCALSFNRASTPVAASDPADDNVRRSQGRTLSALPSSTSGGALLRTDSRPAYLPCRHTVPCRRKPPTSGSRSRAVADRTPMPRSSEPQPSRQVPAPARGGSLSAARRPGNRRYDSDTDGRRKSLRFPRHAPSCTHRISQWHPPAAAR